MARTYKRDSRGRFASGGSSSSGSRRGGAKLPSPTKRAATGKPQRRQGLLTQRSSLARSQAKLKGKDTADKSLTAQLSLRAQKAAVTRAKNKLAAAQKTGRIRLSGRDGVIRPKKVGKSIKSKSTIKFTPEKLADRIAEPSRSRSMRALSAGTYPYPKGSKRRENFFNTERRAEAFRKFLQAATSSRVGEARRAGVTPTKETRAGARIAAFKSRPRYSTRQRVRPSWGTKIIYSGQGTGGR